MTRGEALREFAARWSGPLAIAALAAALLAWTWRAWPDPLVDAGLQLYAGWQLAAGKLLYRDIAWAFGPLSQYAAAAWLRLAGVSLTSLVWLNLLVLAAVAAMLHRLVRSLAGRAAAAAAGLVFVAVFAFGQYTDVGNYNFVFPYTADATHGLAVALAGLLLVARHAGTAGRRSAAGVGACLGLLLLNKPEYVVALLAGGCAGIGGALWARRAAPREWVRTAGLVAAGAAVPVAAAAAWLSVRMGPAEALAALVAPWAALGRASLLGGPLYQAVLGTGTAGAHAREVFWMLVRHAVALVPAFLVWRRCRAGTGATLAGLAAGAAAAALLWRYVHPKAWPYLLLPLPLETAAIAAWAGWRLRGSRGGGEARQVGLEAARLAAAVFALALLGKIALNVSSAHYGFVLAAPATALGVAALVGWLPGRLDAAGGAGGAFRAMAAVLLAVFVVAHWRIESRHLAAKVHPVGQGPDLFLADRRGEHLNAAAVAIRALTPEGATLLVVPEGPVLNYLARREAPAPFVVFLPSGFVEEAAVERMVRERPPDAIAVTGRSVAEFGVGPLGVGYGRGFMALVAREYRLARQVGPSPFAGGNGVAILLRQPRRP